MAKLKLQKWLNQLIGVSIQGGAASFLSTFGLAGASAMGIPVNPLDWKQGIGVFVSGAVVKGMTYLQKQPVPDFDGGTGFMTKDIESTKKGENE